MIRARPNENLRAVGLAALLVGSVLGATVGFSGVAAAANEAPTFAVESPDHEADLTDPPEITGSASDDDAVTTVELRIERASDGKNYTGSGWSDADEWITVFSGSRANVEWAYDTAAQSALGNDDTYTVVARVSDGDGNTVTGERPDERNPARADAGAITYTLDTTDPVVSSVDVTEAEGDDTVSVGDTVRVSADASDAGSGVDAVTVDASKLGGPSALELTGSGGTYAGTFTVSDPSVGDGLVSLTVTATDRVGYTDPESDAITLETSVDAVGSLEVARPFVGIVADPETEVAVTASGVEDARGNVVEDGTVEIDVAGTTYRAPVTDGQVDARIDPTAIDDDAATGEVTVSVADADASATDTLRLVHEVRGLDAGYNLVGTPMSAGDVVFENVSDVTTYDPTVPEDDSPWVSPDEEGIGEGYYAYAENDGARVGYVFEENGQTHPEARYLYEGYNLVGAAPDLGRSEGVRITNDLGAGVDPSSNSDVQASTYTGASLDDEATSSSSAFADRGGSHEVAAYQAYFVHVENDRVVRTMKNDTAAYDPESR